MTKWLGVGAMTVLTGGAVAVTAWTTAFAGTGPTTHAPANLHTTVSSTYATTANASADITDVQDSGANVQVGDQSTPDNTQSESDTPNGPDAGPNVQVGPNVQIGAQNGPDSGQVGESANG